MTQLGNRTLFYSKAHVRTTSLSLWQLKPMIGMAQAVELVLQLGFF